MNTIFQKHRARFLETLQREEAAAVLVSGTPAVRNNDCEYRFRPTSDFFYLTGFREPEAVLVMVPMREEARTVLFMRQRNQKEEIWTGRRLGLEAALETLGVDETFPIEALWDELPGLLRGHRKVVYRSGEDEGRDRSMLEALGGMRRTVRGGALVPLEWVDPSLWLHEQRLFKNQGEIERMRKAASITTEAHLAAMRQAAPGVNEAEIDGLIEYTFKRRGSTGPAYTNIVAGGPNACILHYVENDQPLRDGDLLLIDAGAEFDYYAADVTRTFPVGGTFGPEQRALYEVVLAAQKRAVEHVVPGNSFVSVHETALATLVDGLLELGLLSGSREEVIESENYQRFYMHRTGHWLGLDVHDCGAHYLGGQSRALEAGMVCTVEPGLYIAEDDTTVDARWRGIGIRIEDDVLVTEEENEVLTAAIPKEVEELEAVCSGAELLQTRG